MDNALSFKKFMELQQVAPSYIDKLKDELDINPKAISATPQWLANTTIGNYSYNGMTYEFKYVKNGAGEITGAMVKPVQTQRAYSKDKDNNVVRNPDSNPDSGKEFYVTKDQLNKMLNQEAGANQGQAAGMQMPPGAMGGMGGM